MKPRCPLALAAPRGCRPPAARQRRFRGGKPGCAFSRLAALSLAVVVAGASAQDEVPFVTTPDAVTLAMLELADVKAQDVVIDLGSGDGRIVITAAKRYGALGLGVEIVPDLVAGSQRNARTAGVADRAEFRVQDLFATDLSAASVVTMYLLPAVNLQLRPRLLALKAGTRIVSHDWDMGDWRPDRSVTLDVPDKAIGLDKRSTVHLWVVPAQLQGRWCAADGATLDLTQRFQRFSGSLTPVGAAAPVAVFDGQVAANEARADGSTTGISGVFALEDGGLTLRHATSALASQDGRLFKRGVPGRRCPQE